MIRHCRFFYFAAFSHISSHLRHTELLSFFSYFQMAIAAMLSTDVSSCALASHCRASPPFSALMKASIFAAEAISPPLIIYAFSYYAEILSGRHFQAQFSPPPLGIDISRH